VFERLRSEFAVPTDALQAQLRYWICHHITHHCATGRGGVRGEEDIVVAPVLSLTLDTINDDFRPGDWLVQSPSTAAAPTTGGVFDMDASILTPERLRLLRELVELRERAAVADISTMQARSGGELAVIQARTAEKQVELEMLQLRKRGASPHGDTGHHPKRIRRTALAADTRGVRVSLSHHVWRQLGADATELAAVFRAVHDWSQSAHMRAGLLAVVQMPVGAAADAPVVPVLYMFPEGHARHPGPRRLENCLRHVRTVTVGGGITTTETTPAASSSSSTGAVDAVAVRTFMERFRAPPIVGGVLPPELAPIGVQQQLADTQRLCVALGLTLACWSTLPDEAAGARLPPTAIADWRRRIRSGGPLRVSDFAAAMAWDVRHVNHYHLACLAGSLDGGAALRKDRRTGGYPVDALWVFRRVMVVCREVGDLEHVRARVAETFRMP
jgi:hypothetical protein